MTSYRDMTGEEAFPICMRSGNQEEEQKNIEAIRNQFGMSPINVPEPLYDILSRSKDIKTIENLMTKLHHTGNHKIPNEALTFDQIKILDSALTIFREGSVSEVAP